jgi:hypothetical protein
MKPKGANLMSNFVVGQTITIPQTNSWEAHQAEIIEIADDVLTLLTYIVDHMVASCIRRQ